MHNGRNHDLETATDLDKADLVGQSGCKYLKSKIFPADAEAKMTHGAFTIASNNFINLQLTRLTAFISDFS
jgi:hypothetical protein